MQLCLIVTGQQAEQGVEPMTHSVQQVLADARQHLVRTRMRVTDSPTLSRRAKWAVTILDASVCSQAKESIKQVTK